MLPQFPNWYRNVHPEPPVELLARKWRIVDGLKRRDRAALVPDFVRLAFGHAVMPNGSSASFRTALRKDEPELAPEDIAHEARLMAGVALAAFIESNDTSLADRAALAVLCIGCAGLGPTPMPADLSTIAENHILRRRKTRWVQSPGSISPPTMTFPSNYQAQLAGVLKNPQEGYLGGQAPTIAKVIASGVAAVSVDTVAVANSVTANLGEVWSEVRRLREESNILWWLFSERSAIADRPVEELNLAPAALLAGLEMASLTDGVPGPPAAAAFLSRMLRQARRSGEAVTIYNALAGSDESVVARLRAPFPAELLQLIPIHAAAQARAELQGDDAWIKMAKVRFLIDVGAEIDAGRLALQCYHEQLLRNLLQPSSS